jgi:hypothetical protein
MNTSQIGTAISSGPKLKRPKMCRQFMVESSGGQISGITMPAKLVAVSTTPIASPPRVVKTRAHMTFMAATIDALEKPSTAPAR